MKIITGLLIALFAVTQLHAASTCSACVSTDSSFGAIRVVMSESLQCPNLLIKDRFEGNECNDLLKNFELPLYSKLEEVPEAVEIPMLYTFKLFIELKEIPYYFELAEIQSSTYKVSVTVSSSDKPGQYALTYEISHK